MNDRNLGGLTKLGAVVGLALGLGLGVAGVSAAAAKNEAPITIVQTQVGEPVDSFPVLSRLHDWQVIDNKTVIVWATPWQPYLLQLKYPSHDLPFVQAIGVTSLGDRVYARFDSLRVAGFRYPIDSIYKMTKEEAKELARQS
ncbi:MAG: DUF6491 family protein [Gammaproteobacteria bacterium]